MMRTLHGPWTLFALALLAGGTAEAQAQNAVISGRVTSEAGQPLQGANVYITELNLSVGTNATGNYTITVPAARVTNQSVMLRARSVGFSPQSRQVTVRAGAQTADFALRADVLQLDQVVVTGVAEATSSRNLTVGISRVGAEQINEVPRSNPVAALQGKVAGARVALARGSPGANPVVRLRGSTNLAVGGSSPMLVVDGMITRGTLADFNADDIESIEVLKGAASAASYGSDAANGVIAITTKRGRSAPDNSFSVTARTEYGTGNVERWVPLNQHHPYQLDANGEFVLGSNGRRLIEADRIVDNPFPGGTWRNQQREWLEPGLFSSHYVNVGLRRGTTSISTSYSLERNQGVLPDVSGERKDNFRINVDQGLRDDLDLTVTASYATRNNDLNPGSGDDPFFALLQAPPDVDLRRPNGPDDLEFNPLLPGDKAPNSRGNPLYALFNRERAYGRERLLGSGQLRYRPLDWLSMDALVGTDRLNVDNTDYQFRGYLTGSGTPGNGSYNVNNSRNIRNNFQANVVAARSFLGFNSSSRVQYLLEEDDNLNSQVGTSKLNIDLPNIEAADPTQMTSTSNSQAIRSVSYTGIQQLDYQEKYLTQFSLRRDGSSLFGENNRWATYYQVSGAWRITQDFEIPGIQELKLRAARGTAGLRPAFADQYETYNLSNGNISKSQLGNPDLRPAEQTENEFGVNAEFLDRFALELTYANRTTEGAFLNVPLVSAQNGGFTSQVQNAADVSARTFEVQLQASLINRDNFSWTTNLSADRTRQRIDRLSRSSYNLVDQFGQSQGQQFFYQQGENLGVIYGARWVRDPQELLDNPANASNPAFSLDNFVVNEMGFVVPKAAWRTASEQPIKYVDPTGNQARHRIGDVNPDFSFGWAHDVRWGNFSSHLLVDGVIGGDIYNFSKQWMFQDFRHGDQDQSSKPVEERKPVDYYSVAFYNNNEPNSYFVEDGTYAKLRELSIAYNFSDRLLQMSGLSRIAKGAKVSVIGRNLYTWTDYSGSDPEALAGDDFNFRLDGFRYPALRQFTGQVQINF